MITEVDTKNPWPCCPLMSGHPVPIAPPPGTVLKPNQMAVGPIQVACAEDHCPLFDSQERVCSLQSISAVVSSLVYMANVFTDIKLILEPPKGSPSPLMRVAKALEEIVINQQTKKG